jgi:flagellar biosynthesis/type III secretory pathway M-ring protein FliF/YscJ
MHTTRTQIKNLKTILDNAVHKTALEDLYIYKNTLLYNSYIKNKYHTRCVAETHPKLESKQRDRIQKKLKNINSTHTTQNTILEVPIQLNCVSLQGKS